MKMLLNYAKQHGRTYRDDQLAMVRYMLEHPDQVRLGGPPFAQQLCVSEVI
jgi:hypothetical protein